SRLDGIAQAVAVVMTEHGRTGPVAGPVAAGAVLPRRERTVVHGGAGQHVVHVRIVAAPVDDLTLLVDQVLLGEGGIVGIGQVGDVLRDGDGFRVLPGPAADAFSRVDRRGAADRLRAQIGAPVLAAGTHEIREILAVLIGAGEPAEIGTVATA